MKGRVVVVLLTVVTCTLAPVSAEAKKKPPKPKTPPAGQEPCEQAPPGGKGPIANAELKATEKCFDTLKTALNETNIASGGVAEGCSNASAAFNDQAGKGLEGTASSGQMEIKKTSKAKAGYFNAEAEWYGEHGKKGKRSEQRDLVQNIAQAIGKAAFDASGFYSALSAEASALRNNDCAEATAAHGRMVDASKKFAEDDLPALRKALSAAP